MFFRNVVFTVNNYSHEEYDKIINLDIWRYLVVGKEIGESGTPHLQGYGVLKKQFRDKALQTALGGRAFMEPRKGSHSQASDYCKKDKDFYEIGDAPVQGKRTDLHDAVDTLKHHGIKRVAEEHPTTFVKFSRGFRDLSLMLEKPYEHSDVRGIWIWGSPGVGKSRMARQLRPNAYLKAQSKWFDGYSGERAIILDDFDLGGFGLGHHLKIWADRYACTGETKGGTVNLRHEVLIVTSNYSMDKIWEKLEDVQMLQALKRRFKQFHIPFYTPTAPQAVVIALGNAVAFPTQDEISVEISE